MFSPLEQFENHIVVNLVFPGCAFSLPFTVVGLTVVVNTTVLLTLSWGGLYRPSIVRPNGWTTLVESWWSALSGVVRQQVPHQGFIPLFVWTFGWIALNNIVGLLPGTPTTTAQLATTLAVSLGFNLGFLFWGVYHHGDRFWGLFVPSGAPAALLPLIVVIELVSYCIRPISLALRLFANMMAGHTLVHILLQFTAGLGHTAYYPVLLGAVFGVTLLEFGIALLQAYVFVVLSCIYLKDALSPGH